MKYLVLLAGILYLVGCSAVAPADPCEGKEGLKLAFCKVRNR